MPCKSPAICKPMRGSRSPRWLQRQLRQTEEEVKSITIIITTIMFKTRAHERTLWHTQTCWSQKAMAMKRVQGRMIWRTTRTRGSMWTSMIMEIKKTTNWVSRWANSTQSRLKCKRIKDISSKPPPCHHNIDVVKHRIINKAVLLLETQQQPNLPRRSNLRIWKASRMKINKSTILTRI